MQLRLRFLKTEGWFFVGWMLPARSLPFRQSVSQLVVNLSVVTRPFGHSPLKSTSQLMHPPTLLQVSHVLQSVGEYVPQYMLYTGTAVRCPALDKPSSLGHGPFCKIFSFPPTSAPLSAPVLPDFVVFACRAHASCTLSPHGLCPQCPNARRPLNGTNTLTHLFALSCLRLHLHLQHPNHSLTHPYSFAREITSSSPSPNFLPPPSVVPFSNSPFAHHALSPHKNKKTQILTFTHDDPQEDQILFLATVTKTHSVNPTWLC